MENINIETAREILAAAPIGILMFDADGKIQWYNDTLLKTLNLNAGQLDGQTAATLPAELKGVLVEPPETIFLQKGADQRWLRCHRHTTAQGGKAHFYQDISQEQRIAAERDKLSEELQMLTTRDGITGLPNRRALLQGLEPLVSRSRRYGNPLSVIKLAVELSGHSAPSQPSRENAWLQVGQMLKDQMRWADIIGRYEDATFLLILPETPEEASRQLADKITSLLSEIKITDENGETRTLKPYCGVTSWEKGDDSILLLKRAEEGVAAAKQAGE
ncbi:MAG TPA: diguanylate cyclase [Candidatus Tenderia sp.]|nr:diguanylate cyclase [Candidatus Tenderia sp.]